jgi:hypothetical protein
MVSGTAAANLSARLVTPYINLPGANQHPRLRFWHWFQFGQHGVDPYYADDLTGDSGSVQISVDAGVTWTTLASYGEPYLIGYQSNPPGVLGNSGGVWSTPSIDLSPYAGQTVQIGFLFQSTDDNRGTGAGWYIDDVDVVAGPLPELPEMEDFDGPNFTDTWDRWSVTVEGNSGGGGGWQLGTPAYGPGAAFSGTACVGTDMTTGVAQPYLDTMFVSPWFVVPPANSDPNLSPKLTFEQYYELGASSFPFYENITTYDEAEVEIQVSGSGWQTLETYTGNTGGIWSPATVPLSNYAGELARVAFWLQTTNDNESSGAGWYLDDIEVSPTPVYTPTPEISLQGPGGVELATGASTLNLGETDVGTSTGGTYTISNTGDGDLTVDAITIDGSNSADFSVPAGPAGPVAALGGTAAVTVEFTPGGTGERRATMHILSNDPVYPSYDIGLTGTGTIPAGGEFFFPVTEYVVHNTDGSAAITVSRDYPGEPASVAYNTIDGTGTSGLEYTGTQGTLFFGAEDTQETLTVPILALPDAPGITFFSVQLSNPSSGGTISSSGSSTEVSILNPSTGDLTLSLTPSTPPQAPPAATGSITVNLTPAGAYGQWKLFGELLWRDSGDTAAGLTSANYEVEFKPVEGYQQPAEQVVPLLPGVQATVTGTYAATAAAATGGLQVTLAVPEGSGTGGWRIQGSSAWMPSGETLLSLNPGDYILEFEPVAGAATPGDCEVTVPANEVATVNITYLIGGQALGQGPVLVSATAAQAPPYAFTGLIQTDEGLGSGFVPLDRVVVTAAHVLFDDVSLSYVTGVRWFFQYESGQFEAPPQIPAGNFVMEGYASQRAADNSPGVASGASRQLDAAALYFLEEAGRGGQSGYLASNAPGNPWLTGAQDKFLAGYPIVNGTSGYLYATPSVQDAFQYVAGSVFTSAAIGSYAGNSGGPLFVRYSDGNFYPAAIYLGGSDETVVHAIDSAVIALMDQAEICGNGGANSGSGGIIQVQEGLSGGAALAVGSLSATLLPADAVSAGAYWEIGDGVRRFTGDSADGLAPGPYTVEFFPGGPGFSAPAEVQVPVSAGFETIVTGTYTANAPTITSGTQATAIKGQPFSYQIAVTPGATSYSASGNLPPGLAFDGSTGIISGTASTTGTAGVSILLLSASNAEGVGKALDLALTLADAGKLTVRVSGSGTVTKGFSMPVVEAVGSTISIKATPDAGSAFAYWSDADSGNVLSLNTVYSFTMPSLLDLQANFVVNPLKTANGSYLALLQGGSYSLSGFAQVTVKPNGSFTSTFNLGGDSAKLSSAFDDLGQYNGKVTLPGNRMFTTALSLSAGGMLTGTLSSVGGGSQLALNAERIAPHPDQALAGAYTVVLPAASGTGLPGGNGYGTLTVSKTGAVKFAGQLGDGVPVTISGALDSGGVWPFVFTKAAGRSTGAELVLGAVPFPPAAGGTAGTLDWYRTSDAIYPGGFSSEIPIVAARYAPPAVSATGASVTLAGTTSVPVSINTEDKVTTATGKFTLKFTQKTGLFTGKFEDNGNLLPFAGAVIQSGSFGMGLFKDANGETSPVLFEETQ